MNSSSAKTLGIVLVVFAVLALVGIFRFLIWIPLGLADGVGHGLRSNFFDRDWSWAWPWETPTTSSSTPRCYAFLASASNRADPMSSRFTHHVSRFTHHASSYLTL